MKQFLYWLKAFKSNPKHAVWHIRLFFLGGQDKYHWCGTCGSFRHPNLIERLFKKRYVPVFPQAHIQWTHPIQEIPKSPVRPEDLKAYQETGFNPFFRRIVDEMPPQVFEAVTGASILKWSEKEYVIQILAGPGKLTAGYLHSAKGGIAKYKSRASARGAKSRYLKKLAITDRVTPVTAEGLDFTDVKLKMADRSKLYSRPGRIFFVDGPPTTLSVDTAFPIDRSKVT